jgi:hypothetical protein
MWVACQEAWTGTARKHSFRWDEPSTARSAEIDSDRSVTTSKGGAHAMTHTRRPEAIRDSDSLTTWVGWVAFAGIVMATAGIVNIIQGLIAVFNDDYYSEAGSGPVATVDYAVWGWVLVGTGVLLVVTGYGIVFGRTWADIVGVILATADAILNFAFIPAYPIWGILALSLDVIVIYAVTVHGREAKVLRHA